MRLWFRHRREDELSEEIRSHLNNVGSRSRPAIAELGDGRRLLRWPNFGSSVPATFGLSESRFCAGEPSIPPTPVKLRPR